LRSGQEPLLAAHLVTPRRLYDHHGIYVGNGRVIHYAGFAHGWRRGAVEEISLQSFANGCDVRIQQDAPRFDCREVVLRARSRLGERSYRILTNNCEHFCTWALRDECHSAQVEHLHECIHQSGRLIMNALERLTDLLRTLRARAFGRVRPVQQSGNAPGGTRVPSMTQWTPAQP
jgi:hypothetical protein